MPIFVEFSQGTDFREVVRKISKAGPGEFDGPDVFVLDRGGFEFELSNVSPESDRSGTGSAFTLRGEGGEPLATGSGPFPLQKGRLPLDDVIDEEGLIATGSKRKDVIAGGRNDDQILGGDGKDLILGGKGDDLLFGGEGDDNVKGGGGDDFLFDFGGGDNTLKGQGGDDVLNVLPVPGGGRSVLDGGPGNDVLIAGPGATMIGGKGTDVFAFVVDSRPDPDGPTPRIPKTLIKIDHKMDFKLEIINERGDSINKKDVKISVKNKDKALLKIKDDEAGVVKVVLKDDKGPNFGKKAIKKFIEIINVPEFEQQEDFKIAGHDPGDALF
jgi:hypothetical protein